MINKYFLFYNGQNAEMIDKEEIEIAVSYTKSQFFFYTLFTYGIPIFEIMDYIFENLDKNLISFNDTENINMDEDIFIDEKSNYLRQASTKMKYGLLIGNLILCDKIHKLLEKVYKRASFDESVSDIQKKKTETEIVEYFQEIREFTQYETEFIKYKNMTEVSKKPILSKTDNIEWPNKFIELQKKIEEALLKNEKTMIYSNYVEKGTYLLEIFFNSVFEQKYLDKIIFLVSPDTKEGRYKNSELLKRFNNNNAQIIVFHPDIMEGISLIECMHVHILEYIHQPAKYEQVIARARRNKSHQMTLSKNPNAKLKIYKYIIKDTEVFGKQKWIDAILNGAFTGAMLYNLGFSLNIPAGLLITSLCLGYDYAKHIKNQKIISALSKDSHHFIGSQDDIDLIKSPDGYFKRIYINLSKNNKLFYEMLNDYSLDADDIKMEEKILSLSWNDIDEFWKSNSKYPEKTEDFYDYQWEKLSSNTYL
jgi:hypothetical protein